MKKQNKKGYKKMKKALALVLAVLLAVGAVFTLASCGEKLNFGKEFKALSSQKDLLFQLNAQSVDVGVMDSVMAGYYMSQDSTYSGSLMIVEGLTLATEQYGVAVRKGSGLMKKINAALVELTKDGTVGTIAKKYGLASEVCIDTNATFTEMTEAEKADWDYVVNQGKMIVGYTDFAPISWEKDGELVGFDVELAKAVGAKIGLAVEFKLIDWNAKEALIKSKTIDCIWNGMTITEERLNAWEISIPYMNNKQVAVIRKADAEKYKTTADMKDAIVAAESGSAGESCIVKKEK